MNYNVHYDIAALVITCIIGIHFYLKRSIRTGHTQVFSTLLFFCIVSNVLDIVTSFTIEFFSRVPLVANYLMNMLYFIFLVGITAVYYIYIIIQAKEETLSVRFKTVMVIPMIMAVILVLTTAWTKWIIYFDDQGMYHHGKYIFLIYTIELFYVLVTLVTITLNRDKFENKQIFTVVFYSITGFSALGIQSMYNDLLVLHFAFAIALLLMYLSLENPKDYIDSSLEVYNKNALLENAKVNIRNDRKFQILALKVDGLKYIKETMGNKAELAVLKQVSSVLKQNIGKNHLYYISDDTFAILGSPGKEKWDEYIGMAWDRFDKKFEYNGVGITLSLHMCMIAYPHTFTRLEDIMDMIEYSLLEANSRNKREVVYASDDVLVKGRRELKIVQKMKQALKDMTFQVYYQPIYSVEKKYYTSAEALIRLIDDELGFISPEEFIPLAEQSGLILDIGEFVFREVCRFISTERLWQKGIEYVDVNLSVVQCMQEKLYEKLFEIMDEYRLDYNYVNLEITETAAVISSDVLVNNMNRLKEKGVKFSLDDYGTGYSNTANLIKYEFHTIKLDKSIVWSAMENKKAMLALKHTIAMIKDLEMKLVAEGVENLEQAQQLEAMGCDFFQGYYYHRPVNGVNFLSEISNRFIERNGAI